MKIGKRRAMVCAILLAGAGASAGGIEIDWNNKDLMEQSAVKEELQKPLNFKPQEFPIEVATVKPQGWEPWLNPMRISLEIINQDSGPNIQVVISKYCGAQDNCHERLSAMAPRLSIDKENNKVLLGETAIGDVINNSIILKGYKLTARFVEEEAGELFDAYGNREKHTTYQAIIYLMQDAPADISEKSPNNPAPQKKENFLKKAWGAIKSFPTHTMPGECQSVCCVNCD